MLGNNASYGESFTTCKITPENHGSLLDSLFNMQLASRNPFSGQIVADWVFLQGLLTQPFNMYFDFRPLFRRTFAEPSRKYPYSQTPAISRGRIEGKANTRGLGIYRGWYWGMTVLSWFCSCKVVLPSHKHYIIHAQAKKDRYKVQPSLDKGLLKNEGIWEEALQDPLKKTIRWL